MNTLTHYQRQSPGHYSQSPGRPVAREAIAPNRASMSLATLKRGQKGVITSINTADVTVQRLMVMGLVEGAEVEYASAAIGGDPMEFRLFGNAISLRKEHAVHFTVATTPDGG